MPCHKIMRQLRLIKFLTALLLLNGCADDDLGLNPNFPEELINTWVESYEESRGTYRPSGYMEFPSSRFRQTYQFMEGNYCEYLVLSPVDAHYLEEGKWEYDQGSSTITIYGTNDEVLRELNVTLLTTDLLQIEI